MRVLAWALAIILATGNQAGAIERSQNSERRVDPIAFATALLVGGRPVEACIVLDLAFSENTTSAAALFLYGQCHSAQGNTQLAQDFLKRAGQIAPTSAPLQETPAIATANRAALIAGAPGRGEAVPQTAGGRPAPPPAEAGLLRLVSGSASLARTYDSNVNGGTYHSAVDVLIGGAMVPLIMSADSLEKAAFATDLVTEVAYLQQVSTKGAATLRGQLNASFFDESTPHDNLGLAIEAGYIHTDGPWRVGTKTRASAKWKSDASGHTSTGMDIEARYSLGNGLHLTSAAGIGADHYYTRSEKDATTAHAGVGLAYDFSADWSAGAAIAGRANHADRPTFSHTDLGAHIYLAGKLNSDITVGASYAFTQERYDAPPAAFLQDRIDTKHNFGLTLDWALPQIEGASVFARYHYQAIDSSVPIYDSHRHLLSSGVRYTF